MVLIDSIYGFYAFSDKDHEESSDGSTTTWDEPVFATWVPGPLQNQLSQSPEARRFGDDTKESVRVGESAPWHFPDDVPVGNDRYCCLDLVVDYIVFEWWNRVLLPGARLNLVFWKRPANE